MKIDNLVYALNKLETATTPTGAVDILSTWMNSDLEQSGAAELVNVPVADVEFGGDRGTFYAATAE